MKRLLLPLLAALALPTAVKAESVWLILLNSASIQSSALEKIEMESMEQCEEQGKYFVDKGFSTRGKDYLKGMGYRCIIGK